MDESLTVITRLENLDSARQEVWKDGKLYLTIDYTGLIPTGEKAYDAEKTDFGTCGSVEGLTENLVMRWEGVKAKPTGRLRYIGDPERVQFSGLKSNGCYFPLSLSPWFEGTPHKVGFKEHAETMNETTVKDIACAVTTQYATIKVTFLDVTVLEINLRSMLLEPCVGRHAVSIASAETMMDYVSAGELIDGEMSIDWDKTSGTVHGKLKKHKMDAQHFQGAEGHFLPLVVSNYDGQTIEYVGIGGMSVKAEDTKCIIQADGASAQKKAKVRVGTTLLAELDLSQLEME